MSDIERDTFLSHQNQFTKVRKGCAQRGARTHDRWIKSPTLYRLSQPGTSFILYCTFIFNFENFKLKEYFLSAQIKRLKSVMRLSSASNKIICTELMKNFLFFGFFNFSFGEDFDLSCEFKSCPYPCWDTTQDVSSVRLHRCW